MDLEKVGPVHEHSVRTPDVGIALCLSGGGYRAMLFHAGVLWRLNESGLLHKIKRISSVSGGSITAAVLGIHWNSLSFDTTGIAGNLSSLVISAIRSIASVTIDVPAVVTGMLPWRSASDYVARRYDQILFDGRTLQHLPDDIDESRPAPRFIINATSVQSGVLMRFSRPYMRDFRVGEIKLPKLPIALAVAASSAFPPFLSPCVIATSKYDLSFQPRTDEDLHYGNYLKKFVLCDGGVYDNLGLETAWKRYQTIFVSDGGAAFERQPSPHSDWGRDTRRVLDIIDSQVRALRVRQLIAAYQARTHFGAYWNMRQPLVPYCGASPRLQISPKKVAQLAAIPTRLKCLDAQIQKRLINWGYAVSDASIRSNFDGGLPEPIGFPFPEVGC